MADELIKVPDIGGAEGAEVGEVLVAAQWRRRATLQRMNYDQTRA